MSYHHFTTFEQGLIEELSTLDCSNQAIGGKMDRHHSSVSRELNSNLSKTGCVRRKRSKPKGKHSNKLVALITEKLASTWSPEQIANTVTLGKVSFKSIYNWLYNGKLLKASI